MTEKQKHPGGRPTKYKEQYAEQARKLCLLGYTDKQLADFFEVHESTIHQWKLDYPKFSESINAGKDIADAEIAVSLYERAKGYSHKEDKIFNHNGVPLVVPTIKHYPPDTAAAFIWLKNRSGWRDKQEVEHSVNEDTYSKLKELYGD
jgi:hypothetical protein